MSFTFDLSTDVGKIRAEIADTVETQAIFSDEELGYFLEKAEDNFFLAKIYVAEALCFLATRNAGLSTKVGDISQNNAATYGRNWCELATIWRDELNAGISGVDSPYFYAGGIYQADTDSNNELIRQGILVKRPFWNDYNDSHDTAMLEDRRREC